MNINITLHKEQKMAQHLVEALESELNRRVNKKFPESRVTVKKGSMTGIEISGFPDDSDRERLDVIIQEVWQDESWH